MSPNSSTTFSHYKQQGEWAELLFMARAAEQGLAIARPWGDSSPYDVAIVTQSKPGARPDFLRIQVKSTRCKHHNGYKCHIDSNGVAYHPDQLDFIAAYVIPADIWFIIPFEATQCTRRGPRKARVSPSESATGVSGTPDFRVRGWQLELLLTPHRPTSKYGEYEEAWHLLHNE